MRSNELRLERDENGNAVSAALTYNLTPTLEDVVKAVEEVTDPEARHALAILVAYLTPAKAERDR